MVGVGRYTSVDRMVSLVRGGVLDLIGAARPSIADPFLPRKIEEGRIEDIRECIGCNICVAGDFTQSPIRCTQNPTMAEEWRRGWHPERVAPKGSDRAVLVIGGGPAGLEAAQVLGKRGYSVTLAEARRELGGRVLDESRLPGLAAWIRVRDYRRGQLERLPNVQLFLDNRLSAEDVLGLGIPKIVVATGSRWRRDAVGRYHTRPIAIDQEACVLTPDDLMAGRLPGGRRVVIWDDDHYYMGGVLAELCAERGFDTWYVTPASEASTWDARDARAAFHPGAPVAQGRTHPSFSSRHGGAARRRGDGLRVHGRARDAGGGRRGAGHRAASRRRPGDRA